MEPKVHYWSLKGKAIMTKQKKYFISYGCFTFHSTWNCMPYYAGTCFVRVHADDAANMSKVS
jgi:hypothetical protein